MTTLPKHIKLFHNAGIDYITSFIKLWLSFNAWYKKEFEHENPKIKTDSEAISKCKIYNRTKGVFLKLLHSTNPDEQKRFQESLVELYKIKSRYPILNKSGVEVFDYVGTSEIRLKDFRPQIQFSSYTQIYSDLYVENGQEEKLFECTLDIIYGLRCQLFHGDFDIDNRDFEKITFHAHSILHILLEKLIF